MSLNRQFTYLVKPLLNYITTKFFILGQVNYEGLTNLINDSSDDVTQAIIKLKKIIQDLVQPFYIKSSTPILQTELAENLPYLNYVRRVMIDLYQFTETQKRKSTNRNNNPVIVPDVANKLVIHHRNVVIFYL